MIKRLLTAVLVVAGLLASDALAGNTNKYPRTFSYGGMRSNGWPLIKYVNPNNVPYPPVDSALDYSAIKAIARYQMISLDMAPIIPWRPDIIPAIKSYNPRIIILAYVLANHYSTGPTADSTVDFLNQINSAIRSNSGILYDTNGNQWLDNYTVNWAKRAVVDTMVSIWKSRILTNENISGLMIDCIAPAGISWTTPYFGRNLDLNRAGYATNAQFDSAWSANTTRAINNLRTSYPTKIFIFNAGTYTQPADTALTGRMWENFPYLELGGNYGGSITAKWDTVMSHYTYERGNYSIIKGEHSQVSGSLTRSSVYGQEAMRQARYVLGSAAMGSGWGTYGNDRNLPYTPPSYPTWWYDEYSVKRTPGTTASIADTAGRYVGWLGTPSGSPIKITSGTGSGCYVRLFKYGRVVVNPKSDTLTYRSGLTTLKKITGVMDPTTNNGQIGTAFKMPAYSALFLLNTNASPQKTSKSFLDILIGVFR